MGMILRYPGRFDPETGKTEVIEIMHKDFGDHVDDVLSETKTAVKYGIIGAIVFALLRH
jgi:hypothetical protein